MKKFILAASAALTFVVVGCASSAQQVQQNNKENACQSGCISGRDRCVSECQSRASSGDNPDNASCQLACDDARKECNDKCTDD